MEAQIGDAAEDHTCRICRGEGAEDAPLFHPCKCRGSIKYIHQECLEEWLKHSNKKGATCDICHQRYKFTTVYDENTPDRVPLYLLFQNIRTSLWNYSKYVFRVFELVVGCIVQIPFFWAGCSRLLTWMLDGHTYHRLFALHMIYGDEDFEGDGYNGWNIFKSLSRTYIHSFLTLLITGVILVILFFLYEKVVKDSGFIKLVKRNIGEERLVRLGNGAQVPDRGNWLQAGVDGIAAIDEENGNPVPANEGDRLDEALRNLERLQRLVQDVDGLENPVVAEAVERLLERHIELRRQLDPPAIDPENGLVAEEDENEDPDFNPDDTNAEDDSGNESLDLDSDEGEPEDTDAFQRFARFERNALPNNNIRQGDLRARRHPPADAEAGARPNFNAAHVAAPAAVPARMVIPQAAVGIRPPPPPAALVPPRQNAFEPGNQPIAFDAEAEDFLASLQLETVIVLADVFIATFLVVFYCIPTLLGTLIYQLIFSMGSFCSMLERALLTRIGFGQDSSLISYSLIYDTLQRYFPQAIQGFELNISGPLVDSFSRLYYQNTPLTNAERCITLLIFYGLGLLSILGYLKIQETTHSARNPLLGFQRKLYIFWFGVVSTLKVFLVFFLQLVIFPAFCGFLLFFVISPLISKGSILRLFV